MTCSARMMPSGAGEARSRSGARKPRNVARNRRIYDLHAEGKSATVIAKAEGLTASQVRRVLKKKRP